MYQNDRVNLTLPREFAWKAITTELNSAVYVPELGIVTYLKSFSEDIGSKVPLTAHAININVTGKEEILKYFKYDATVFGMAPTTDKINPKSIIDVNKPFELYTDQDMILLADILLMLEHMIKNSTAVEVKIPIGMEEDNPSAI